MRLSCSVCLEKINEDSELVALAACGHVFDAECIKQCMRLNDKCPLCKRPTFNNHPAYNRVYFSAVDDDDDDGKNALLVVKKDLKATKADLDILNREYDDLALKWTVAEDKLNIINREKTQLEKDNARKDKQIEKVTYKWQISKARNKDDSNRMNLKLIAKQKSIDLLTGNLDKSNKRIKSLMDELDIFKYADIQDNILPSKSRYRDQNFKTKYYDLNKKHKALKDKMGQLEKKFIDLTLMTPEPSSCVLPSKTEALQPPIQLLEKQVQASKSKENKPLKNIMRLEPLKQDVVKEKEDLQAKLVNAEATIASLEHDTKMNNPPREEVDCNTLSEEA